jgi:hypothetical protein
MRNKEFDIVRDLMAGRTPPPPEATHQGLTLAPASFREIDGEVLARQYVAHRKFLESEAQAKKSGTEEILASGTRTPGLRGERRQDAGHEEAASGWFSGLSRFWRR